MTDTVAVGKVRVENHTKVFDLNFTKYLCTTILNCGNTCVVVTPPIANIMSGQFLTLIFILHFFNQGSNNLRGLFNILVASSVFPERDLMHIINTQGKATLLKCVIGCT